MQYLIHLPFSGDVAGLSRRHICLKPTAEAHGFMCAPRLFIACLPTALSQDSCPASTKANKLSFFSVSIK